MNKRTRDRSSLGSEAEQRTEPEASELLEQAQPTAVCYPVVADQAEWSEVITLYDRQHFLTYARLLSAEHDEVDWRDGVREILLRDPDKDPRQARICWESHLERARWITTEGVRQAVARANAQ